MTEPLEGRRVLAARKLPIFHRMAQILIRLRLTPNQVSVLSLIFGVAAGASLFEASKSSAFSAGSGTTILLLVLVIIFIQLRLFCNLVDGLMAIEGGLKTSFGEIYNDFPDRVSDIAILLGAGYAVTPIFPWGIELGWLAALLAVMTAYTRVLGVSCKTPHYFVGPMAKQHRMFLMTVACFGSMIEVSQGQWGYTLAGVLILICLGSVITCLRRLALIAKYLDQNHS